MGKKDRTVPAKTDGPVSPMHGGDPAAETCTYCEEPGTAAEPLIDGNDGGPIRTHDKCAPRRAERIDDGKQIASPALGAEKKRPIQEVVADYISALAAEIEATKPRTELPEIDARKLAESVLAKRLHAADSSYTIVLPDGTSRIVLGRKMREPKNAKTMSADELTAFEARRYYLDELKPPKSAGDL